MKSEKPNLTGTLSLKYTDAELRTAKLINTGTDANGNPKPKTARIYLPESYGGHRVLCLLIPDDEAAAITAEPETKRSTRSAKQNTE